MRFCSIASGSDGNCHYVEGSSSALLIDAGLSGKHIRENMEAAGLAPDRPEAIFVTHEHSDHVAGIAVWAKKFRVPVYATEGSWKGMGPLAEKVPGELARVIRCDESVRLGGMTVTPIPLCHDANDPVGYLVEENGASAAVVTDTGVMTEEILGLLSLAQLAVVESNYDEWMLRHGPYPVELQRRIRGSLGHLSNDDCGETLAALWAYMPSGRYLLGHLSQNNNTPERAEKTVRQVVAERLGAVPEGLFLTHRGLPTQVFEI